MEFTISLDAGRHSDRELRSLLTWLREHRTAGTEVRLERPPMRPGEMGALSDVVEILAPGGAAAALVMSLQTWLQSRRVEISMSARRSDGAELSIDQTGGRRVDDESIRQLRDFIEGGSPAASEADS